MNWTRDKKLSSKRWCGLFLFAIWTALDFAAQAVPQSSVESQALAIIEARCLSCHGAELKTSGLDLSTLQTALQGGSAGPALKPGQPAESLLLKRVIQHQMPPGKPLPQEEKTLLSQWILEGAPWSGRIGKAGGPSRRAGLDWWALQPLREQSPPDRHGLASGMVPLSRRSIHLRQAPRERAPAFAARRSRDLHPSSELRSHGATPHS